MKPLNTIPSDLIIAQKYAYEPLGLALDTIVLDNESQDYGACEFSLHNLHIKFRTAKITPTKTGQFVTFWKRTKKSPILPYDLYDPFDLLIISVRNGEQLGQFVFSKSVLLEQNIISKNGIGGKRALRVYPSWCKPDNKQAKKTQDWQLSYFIEIQPTIAIPYHLKQLLS